MTRMVRFHKGADKGAVHHTGRCDAAASWITQVPGGGGASRGPHVGTSARPDPEREPLPTNQRATECWEVEGGLQPVPLPLQKDTGSRCGRRRRDRRSGCRRAPDGALCSEREAEQKYRSYTVTADWLFELDRIAANGVTTAACQSPSATARSGRTRRRPGHGRH